MKIAIVANWFLPVPPKKYGGTEQVIFYIIKGLLELGHEPILIGTGDSDPGCPVINITDKAMYFPNRIEERDEQLKQNKIYEKKIIEILNDLKGKVDIIHSHGFDLSDFQDIPNITTLHGKVGFDNVDYFVQRQHFPYVAISNNQQESLPQLNYVGVVYNGEDPSQFPIITEPEDYVCFLGRFDREKNPHLAIQLAINRGIKIKVAGKLDFMGNGYFAEEVEPYFSHPLVEYLGELNFVDKIKLLSNAKCNLHPTNFREPFGLTVLEAAYCGTPTFAVARGSMPELIEEGRTGILVEDFVEGYVQLDNAFELDREYIATRARALFNYQNMAKQYVKIYEKVIAQYEEKTRDPLFE
jgi:glycosyltransferase involved in cell wall biosynthesis